MPVGGNWPVLDYSHWVGKPIQTGGPPNSNLNNLILQPLDSVKGHNVESLHKPLNQNYTQWTPRPEHSKILTIKNPLNTNETLIGQQNFNFIPIENQRGIYSGSTGYDQQILNSRAFSIIKSQPENECADSPTLTTNSERSEITEASSDYNFHRGQQHEAMQQPGYNDMQVLQQHMMFKQLQEFQRQQQLGDLRQQSPLNQFSNSPRQVAGVQFSSPLINGTPVQDTTQMLRNWMQPGQALRSIGLTQEIDVSLYGTPVNMSHNPYFQGTVHDSVAKAGGFGNSLEDMKSNFGQLPVHGLNSGIFPGNLQEGNMIQANSSMNEFNASEEQIGSVPLDPMEAKILYNMDENIWDAFGSKPDTSAVGFGNTLENQDSNSFQCGTWSALMQSAVAEASSSDTGLQEEWSGLTFQNTEQSTNNQILSSFVDSQKQPVPMVTDSSTSSTFPGFHQQRENHDDSSKGLASHEKGGQGEHLKYFGNFSSSGMNVDKGSIPIYQRSLRALEEVPPRGDHGSNAPASISPRTRLSLSSARSPWAINDLNSTQVNAELGENIQAMQNLFSFNSSLPSHEVAQRTHWDNKTGSPGPNVDMQVNPTVALLPNRTSQLLQSSHLSFPGSVSNSIGQPFPNLPISHQSILSGMTQQGENSTRPYNVWRNVPTQRQPFSNLPSSMVSANNNTTEGGYRSSEAISTSSDIQGGYDHLEESRHVSSGGMSQGKEHISDVSVTRAQAMNNALDILRFGNLLDGKPNTTSQPDSFPLGDFQVLGKPCQNLHIQPPLERVDVSSGQVSSSQCIEPLEVPNQVAVMRPKKRKFMALELVPWHKEVMHQSKKPQNMSVAEQDWARGKNRLIEKVEDEVETIGDLRPIHRSKRRLVLTTQLLQQLFRPPPASIFSADAAANYSIISYFVSRLSLADASSLSYCSVNRFLAPLSNNNASSEKMMSGSNRERISEVVNIFRDKTKQLEDEFNRLDKTASIAIIRAELMELERFSVINRFAKFHVRGQIDGTSSAAGVLKASPQRLIVAIPMPQHLPELGVQCFSL